MGMFDSICIDTFLKQQLQLFPQEVAVNEEEALEFLEDVCAVVCKNKEEVMEFFEDEMDISGMSVDDVLAAEEVFSLPDGRYLIVEG